jgi:hypothetical protein
LRKVDRDRNVWIGSAYFVSGANYNPVAEIVVADTGNAVQAKDSPFQFGGSGLLEYALAQWMDRIFHDLGIMP